VIGKATESASMPAGAGPELFFQAGKERAEALLNTQKELLDAYQEVCRNRQTRAKSEIDAWSELAKFDRSALRPGEPAGVPSLSVATNATGGGRRATSAR
jgi:hypothetical protein